MKLLLHSQNVKLIYLVVRNLKVHAEYKFVKISIFKQISNAKMLLLNVLLMVLIVFLEGLVNKSQLKPVVLLILKEGFVDGIHII